MVMKQIKKRYVFSNKNVMEEWSAWSVQQLARITGEIKNGWFTKANIRACTPGVDAQLTGLV